VLPAVVGLTAAPTTPGTATIQWAPLSEANSYRIEWDGPTAGFASTAGNTGVVSGLVDGSSTTITVYAVENGVLGSPASTTVTTIAAPDAPSDLSASADAAGGVTVSWAAPAPVGHPLAGYALEFRTDLGPGIGFTNFATLFAVDAGVTTAHTATLPVGFISELRVTAATMYALSEPSTAVSVVPWRAIGSVAAPVLAQGSPGSLDATWTTPDLTGTGQTITGYTIDLFDTGDNAVDSASTGAATLAHSFTGLAPGTPYRAILTAHGSMHDAVSVPSNYAATVNRPDYVQNVVITGGSSEVTVTWDAAGDNGSAITSYDVRIYFCSTGAYASIKDGQPASPTSFTQVATPGDEVYARVWANNAVGSSSG
ncbi:MAG: fibronectin type III domain-containing protein, partial [Actinomycetia bacterium]|nr:fibronectin type III domain-containing protein [Actinomycetes bacterium]